MNSTFPEIMLRARVVNNNNHRMNRLLVVCFVSSCMFRGGDGFETAYDTAMLQVVEEQRQNYSIEPIFTVGEALPSLTNSGITTYTPPGLLDGMGALKLDENTVRLFCNHELSANKGSLYELCADFGCTSTYSLRGSRLSFFDFDIESRRLKNSGIAYKWIYDAFGNLVTSANYLRVESSSNFGLSRFCSAQFLPALEFGNGRGVVNNIQIAPEEISGNVGGSYWALDVARDELWKVPALGRGAWESLTQVDTNLTDYVALVLTDDTSPRTFGTGTTLRAPLYMYVGIKSGTGDFLDINGLRNGTLYVWVPTNPALSSAVTFAGTGNTNPGTWKALDNSRNPALAAQNGANGFDIDGYPTQPNLWTQAHSLGAFGFVRPEDISTLRATGNRFVVTSTGSARDGDADLFGTLYAMTVTFSTNGIPLGNNLEIMYDGDGDVTRSLRSPDNLDWADDGLVYVTEDKAASQGVGGEFLFGPQAVNKNEAQLVKVDPRTAEIELIGEMDRNVVIDPTTTGTPVDRSSSSTGAWESTGILDVSLLFGLDGGSLFVFNVQAHGITDQGSFNADSRIVDSDLAEGGQLLFLAKEKSGNISSFYSGDLDVNLSTEEIIFIALGCIVLVAAVVAVQMRTISERRTHDDEAFKISPAM